jgi:hypothetical protein
MPRKIGRNRPLAEAIGLVVLLAIIVTMVGCGYGQEPEFSVQSTDQVSSITASVPTSSSTAPPVATTKEVTVQGPDLASQPEEILHVSWGAGPGEVTKGKSDFGVTGPNVMAVSPDGRVIAVYDSFASSPRINLYVGGTAAGALGVETGAIAIAVTDRQEVYALYQARPTSTIVRFAASGELLENISLDGALDPADLVWTGSDLYVLAGAGGTDAAGYLRMVAGGTALQAGDYGQTLGRIQKEYPLGSAKAVIDADAGGQPVVTVTAPDKSSSAAKLVLPASLSKSQGFIDGSALGGLPVVVLFDYPSDGGPAVGCFVAVDTLSGTTRMATVHFDWKMAGGDAAIGADAVYYMRFDVETGMQLLRAPFK